MDWRWDFTFDVVLPKMWEAAGVTVWATLASFALALVGGLILMLLKTHRSKWVSRPATEVIEVIRATPLLVQIFFLFFLLPEIGITLPPLTTGILAIGLYNSALCAEVYRAGFQAVPKGQWEACIALNMSTYRTFKDVIIPQSLPPIVPALGNYLVAIFKETPLLSFVAVAEIMQVSKLIGAEYYRFTEAITIAGLFFLVMSLIAAFLIRIVENYVKRSILH
ncbi:ectoine/hydroxyectoine ABC transporter permease subunit EhuD [Ruegeria sp.]|uniref:ectoine/hydroxyectoine ABC transporter permease subunit EhuD n=1 Tax=Ruegeria sp. TaxID=1879320 RepID=UPI0023275A8E|nr:ectoine/hydroxyectoine ABC transporter permease subunit EhuD [Ruegeria sp.]MDA7965049.1 ectoine/hydroxyectoine ABC transporter permease subunit EhuD [Ruegeria sp.]